MKTLGKFIAVIFILSLNFHSFAQSVGIKAGFNMSNWAEKDDDDTYSSSYKMNPGFNAGVIAEIPFPGLLSLESGVIVNTKGFQDSEEEFGIKVEGKTNLLYVDIPVTLKLSIGVGGIKVYGLAGPYVGMGLSGKVKITMSVLGIEESEDFDIKWDDKEDEFGLKRLDYGILAGAGAEIGKIQVGASYGLGLANISPTDEGGYKINNRVIQISVALKFGR